ncbi:hypothetical protein VTK26DRAFT_8298 [Humicola hyalothermophila]
MCGRTEEEEEEEEEEVESERSWYLRARAFLSELEDDSEQERDNANQLNEEEEGEEDDEEVEDEEEEDEDEEEENEDEDQGEEDEERSYDGWDADYYYELKAQRTKRKREKLREREWQPRKEKERDMEKAKEEEVRIAYRFLKKARKKGKTIPIGSLAGQEFKLFCSDHVDHFYSYLYYPTKRVEFYHLDDEDNPRLDKPKLGSEIAMLYGQVYLDVGANCDFGPFPPPKRASRKAVKVKSCDGTHELSVKFLGNGYLKLRVSREMVFMGCHDASPLAFPPTAPEAFEFVGIWRDREKEKAEQETPSETPSSPETWFEMTHPMGSWKQRWIR